MKKLKISFLALLFTVGIGAAFATTSRFHKKLDNPNWQTANSDGTIKSTTAGGVYHANLSAEDAQANFGCDGSSVDCAMTVQSQNTPLSGAATYILKD